MATYIILSHLTEKGIREIRESPARLDANKKVWREMGAELKEFYLTMGRYDMIAIVEAPDDETVTKVLLSMGSLGAVRTETVRAFTEGEYRKIIASLP
jgi:uncharacterized protein with GYD domain